MPHSSLCWSTAACGEAKRSHSTGPTLILTPSCYGYVALAQVDGELVVTERAKSRRAVPLSPTAEKVFRHVRTRQWAERLMAGSMWQPTPCVGNTMCTHPGPMCPRRAPKMSHQSLVFETGPDARLYLWAACSAWASSSIALLECARCQFVSSRSAFLPEAPHRSGSCGAVQHS